MLRHCHSSWMKRTVHRTPSIHPAGQWNPLRATQMLLGSTRVLRCLRPGGGWSLGVPQTPLTSRISLLVARSCCWTWRDGGTSATAIWSHSCNYWESSLATIWCPMCPTRKGGEVKMTQRLSHKQNLVSCLSWSPFRPSPFSDNLSFYFSVSPDRVSHNSGNRGLLCSPEMQHIHRSTEVPLSSFSPHQRGGMCTALNVASC